MWHLEKLYECHEHHIRESILSVIQELPGPYLSNADSRQGFETLVLARKSI